MTDSPDTPTPPEPGFRSGAVARMAGMPVSTLRIWEQRYRAVAPSTAPTGHRLYSAADVARVALLRQLTDRGHAIGSLAGLDMAQLQHIAAANTLHTPRPGLLRQAGAAQQRSSLRAVVVGPAMAHRLQRLALQPPGAPLQVVAVFDTLTDAAQAAAPAPVDVLLWQTAGVQADALFQLGAAQAAWAPRAIAVVYRFASRTARNTLARSGAVATREPADDDALAAWLGSLHATPHESPRSHRDDPATATHPWLPAALAEADSPPPAPRFDDTTLTAFTGLSNGVACDCPTHVAELLMQITAFETYSADCTHRSPADAHLHAHLQRVAAAARVLFEHALDRVAQAEGWTLPTPHHYPMQKATP